MLSCNKNKKSALFLYGKLLQEIDCLFYKRTFLLNNIKKEMYEI
jgi:hypothetical protein